MTDSYGSTNSVEIDPRKDNAKKQREEFEKTARKFRTLIKKQDQLLRGLHYIILLEIIICLESCCYNVFLLRVVINLYPKSLNDILVFIF